MADEAPAHSEVGRAAALHGAELLRPGYSIDQVVHEYGDICQSVTAIAVELNEKISADEFRTLNRCLDDAIADAVKSFGSTRQLSIDDQVQTVRDRVTIFVDDYRRLVDIATQAHTAIRTGNVGVAGATGTLLTQSLSERDPSPTGSCPRFSESDNLAGATREAETSTLARAGIA